MPADEGKMDNMELQAAPIGPKVTAAVAGEERMQSMAAKVRCVSAGRE